MSSHPHFCRCGVRLHSPEDIRASFQNALDEATALTPPGAPREDIWSAYCHLSARVARAMPQLWGVCSNTCTGRSKVVAHG